MPESDTTRAASPPTDDPLIVVTDLTVRYGEVTALRDVSVNVAPGEIVGVLGPNGAGKSTLMRTIAGVHRPASGLVRVAGYAVAGGAPEKVASRGLRLVPEGRKIFEPLTVEENLRVGAVKGLSLRDELERAYTRFPILGDRRRQSAGTLSGGEQQQLAIARALMSHPRIILYDEPSLGLAPRIVDQILELITELRMEGVTSVLVEQNATRALEIADRAYLLAAGVVAASGTSRELSGSDLASHYLGIGQ